MVAVINNHFLSLYMYLQICNLQKNVENISNNLHLEEKCKLQSVGILQRWLIMILNA